MNVNFKLAWVMYYLTLFNINKNGIAWYLSIFFGGCYSYREDYEECCENYIDEFCELEKDVNLALLNLVVDVFKETTEPLERLVKAAMYSTQVRVIGRDWGFIVWWFTLFLIYKSPIPNYWHKKYWFIMINHIYVCFDYFLGFF